MSKKRVSQIVEVETNGFLVYLESLPVESRERARSRYASMAVRLWYDAEGADGYRKKAEREKIVSLIQEFFKDDSLFPTKTYSADQRKGILKDLLDSESVSLNMEEVADYLKSLPDTVRISFFHDACYIISIDKHVATKEVEYLEKLGKLFGIPQETIIKEFQLFWIGQ